MTLSTTASRVSYAANGATTTFAFAFRIWAAANLKVYLRNNTTLADMLQTLGSDYSVDVASYPNTGNVVFAAAPSSGQTVVIVRDMPLTQDLDLIASGSFAAENVEVQLDKLAAEIQTLRELIARSPRFNVGAALSDVALPEPRAAVGNQILGVTAAGDGFELKAPVDLSLQTVSSFIGTLLDDADAATARATLGIGSAVDLNLLTTDNTGGAHADFVPFIDASEANASNKVPVPNLFSVAITGSADTTPSDPTAYEAMTRRLSDGTLHKMLLAEFGIGKQTVWIPAGSMTARTTSGAVSGTVETTTNKVMIRTLDFDAAAAEYAQFHVQMPKGWNEGTVSAVFVWSHAATGTNFGVVWGIQAVALSDDDALDAAFGTAQTVTDTGGTTNDLYRSTESAAVTIGGTPAENDVVVFQVYRDAASGSDTLAIDARLHGVALFYTTNANTDN
jgi:hypothetical protein